MKLEKLENILGYTFHNKSLLTQALVHRSYLNEKVRDAAIEEHNERLEFLGDAVLELVVTDYLYSHVKEAEGILTSLRAALVNYKIMAQVGIELGVDDYVLVSRGERDDFDKAKVNIVADCMEAIIGAIYLDADQKGLEKAREFIHAFIVTKLPEILQNGSYRDHKTVMQEFCQKHTKITPKYRVISSEGKDHEKVFLVGVWVGNEKLGEGSGRSKQDAETEAARLALEVLFERYGKDLEIPELAAAV